LAKVGAKNQKDRLRPYAHRRSFYGNASTLLGSDTARVNVHSVPDGGNTLALLGFAACGLLVFKRASNRRQLPVTASAK